MAHPSPPYSVEFSPLAWLTIGNLNRELFEAVRRHMAEIASSPPAVNGPTGTQVTYVARVQIEYAVDRGRKRLEVKAVRSS